VQALEAARQSVVYEVPSEILVETLALRYSRAGKNKGRASRALLDLILDAGFLVVSGADPAPAMELYRKRRGLSYPDAVAVMQARDAELLTFDERQLRVWQGLRKGYAGPQ
jgi:hypothetical protein